jgi:hypothetical protein
MRILMREELEERLEEGILSLLDEFGGWRGKGKAKG